MSLKDGLAAINLEMPDRVPRTEYSAHFHWELVNKVVGSNVSEQSTPAQKKDASQKFLKAWNYGFNWNVLINNSFLGKHYTDMGHASYAADDSDFRKAGKIIFEDIEDVFAFDPEASLPYIDDDKIIELFNKDYDAQCDFAPDCVNTTGTYITCMSGLIDMLGWDMLLTSAGYDAKALGEMTNRYSKWIERYFVGLSKCKSPVVKVHDDIVWTSGAFISPEWYRTFIFPNYERLFKILHEAGKKIIYTSDGTYTEFIDDIVKAGVDGFVMEPTTDMQYIADKYGKTHSFIGNADTRILLMGTRDDIEAEVKRCMNIGKSCPGFFLAVGNHIPSNTPIDNALWYNDFYEKMSIR